MMLESPVPRNWHAGFGGRHSEKGSNAPRRVPTQLLEHAEMGVCLMCILSDTIFGTISHL